MANMHKHPVRGLRGIPSDLWDAFDQSAKGVGADRSALLRQFMEWHTHQPGAELPARPEPPKA
ncbi:hypothetical protein ACGFZP_12890 [Kitasatospora sp. NPDC048239]|uniref:hypothetical protein n=1 Tax=Kitasatospora sp. NPDC048239 TaxID=3364046 RepID=UPI00370F948D